MSFIKNKIRSKSILVGVLIFFLFSNLFFIPRVKAGYWGESLKAEFIHEAWAEALAAFKEAMISNLKMQATRLMNDRIMALVTGRSSGSLVISDYGDFIYGTAQRQGQLFSNNLFSSLSSGASRATNDIMRNAETAVNSEIFGIGRSAGATIDDYVSGGLDNVFNENNGGGSRCSFRGGKKSLQ